MKAATSCILGLLLISSAWGSTETTAENHEDVTSTPKPAVPVMERRQDLDNHAEGSAVTSFSSVVIHHPSVGSGTPTTSQWTIESHRDGETAVSTNRGPGRAASRQASRDTSHSQASPQQQQQDATTQRDPPTRHRSRHQTRGSSFDSTRAPASEGGLLKTGKNYYRIASLPDNVDIPQTPKPPHREFTASTPVPQYSPKRPAVQTPQPPPGMTNELLQSLLNQQPQTFDYGYKTGPSNNYQRSVTVTPEPQVEQPTRPTRKPQKKYKGQVQSEAAEKAKKRGQHQKRPDTFNVGYSIGFGNSQNPQDSIQPHQSPFPQSQQSYQDVVLGKPKGPKGQIQVNGEHSVWREVQPGLEISQEHIPATPLSVPVRTYGSEVYDPQIGLLKTHQGTPVYLVNGLAQPEILSAPTTGQSTFDHDYAIGHSNTFDFSNAVSQPYAGSAVSPQSKQDTPTVKRPKLQGINPNKKNKYADSQAYVNTHTPLVPIMPQPIGLYPYSLDFQKGYSGNSKANSNYLISSPTGKMIHSSGKQELPTQGFDLSNLMGVGTPVPIQNVYIPGPKQGEGQMVPAIVIPLSQLAGFENFGAPYSFTGSGDAKDNYGFGSDVFNVVPPPNMKSPYSNPRPHNARHNLKGRTKLDKSKNNDSSKQASFVSPTFGDPSPKMKQPISRNARLAKLQKELNSILAEEMYRKNHPSRSGPPVRG